MKSSRGNIRGWRTAIYGPTNPYGRQWVVPLAPIAVRMAFVGWMLLRRDRRLRKIGHCLACAYDLRMSGADAACSECGSWKRIAG